LDVFHCPADVGYPSIPVEDDSPRWNANRPCWSTLGNSYRANMCSIVLGMSGTSSSGAYALGPWGHARSTLSNPSRLVLAADPLFYSQVDPYPSAPDAVYRGWHNSWRKENALFCDGSARATSTEGAVVGPGRRPLSSDGLGLDLPPIESGLENTLEAGPTWQVDGYPTPGAVIFGDWHLKLEGEDAQYWPWLGGYTNP